MSNFLERRPGHHVPATERVHYPPAEAHGQVDPADFKLGEYWSVLRKRKWVVIASLAVVVAVAALASFRATKVYEAVGRIAIFRETPMSLLDKDPAEAPDEDSLDIDTQIKILQSDTVALEVVKRLELHRNPLVVGAAAQNSTSAFGTSSEIDPKLQPALLDFVHKNLRIVPVPKTRVVEIHFTSTDPRLAADAANATAAAFVEQNFKTRYEATVQTSEWLSRQLADLQVRSEAAQEKLAQYQKENGIVGADEKQNVIISKLDELNKELTAAETDRIRKEALYRMALSGDPTLLSKVTEDSLLERLRAQEADLSTQLAQLSTQFGPAYPKILELNQQLDQVRKSIENERKRTASQLESDYTAALERERLLRKAFEQQKAHANSLNEKAIEFNILKRDVETSRALYDGLLQKLKEAGLMASLRSSNVRIVDPARVPMVPARPNIPRNLQIAFAAGLLGGIGLAFVTEALDRTIRTPEQVQMTSGLATLGVIPLEGSVASGKRLSFLPALPSPNRSSESAQDLALVAASRPASQIAESYRALRTSVLLSSSSRPKVLLVTSSLPEEGKTTTAINTAIVLAQRGGRVLLIDADLRRPNIHRMLGIRSENGLSSVLTGNCNLSDALHESDHCTNLFVLPAGPIPPSPSELLASQAMRELLERCRNEFDHVLIDTPPVLSVTDAVSLSVDVDAAVLVVRSAGTMKPALRRACELLRQVKANILGVVLNAVDMKSEDSYYYRYHYYSGGRDNPYHAAESARAGKL